MKVIVNAIPLVNINTGIGRYVKCLYSELERCYGTRLEIGYFDGVNVLPSMPDGPENLHKWASLVDLFWKLPPRLALLARLAFHYKKELKFYNVSKNFDIYHETAFFPFRVPDSVKTIFTVHDMSLIRHPHWHPKERVLFCDMFFKKRLKNVKHFLSVSAFTASELNALFDVPLCDISVTPLAHDPELFFLGLEKEKRKICHKYNLPGKYFLFVGSGDPRKNAGIIPKAIEESGLDIPLVVVGWGGWAHKADNTKNIISLGYVPDRDLPLIYNGAMALIYPSVYEGFGLPVLEAMACGCPVVTTKMASLPEVGGKAAIYLDNPHSSNELGDILISLSREDSLRRKKIHHGIEHSKKFSWGKTAEKTMRCFEDQSM